MKPFQWFKKRIFCYIIIEPEAKKRKAIHCPSRLDLTLRVPAKYLMPRHMAICQTSE
jgi:hypothetical protein